MHAVPLHERLIDGCVYCCRKIQTFMQLSVTALNEQSDHKRPLTNYTFKL